MKLPFQNDMAGGRRNKLWHWGQSKFYRTKHHDMIEHEKYWKDMMDFVEQDMPNEAAETRAAAVVTVVVAAAAEDEEND